MRWRWRAPGQAEVDLTASADDGAWLPARVRPAAAAVRGDGLSKRYGEGDGAVDALRDVTVSFALGSFGAIMGPSGSGKSTLLHLLAGLDTPTGGSVELAGVPIDGLDDDALTALRRTHVGFVFQAFNLLPALSAEDNILLPLRIAGVRPDTEWADTVIRVCGLAERRRHRPAELSGGQQQRLAIARALVARPTVVFADEPTGNIDSAAGDEILALLRLAVDEFGQTVVLVTHDPLAAARADRVVFLIDGRIVGEQLRPTAESIIAALRDR
jgi:putative ABC transport system ATP-binding protein